MYPVQVVITLGNPAAKDRVPGAGGTTAGIVMHGGKQPVCESTGIPGDSANKV